MPKQTQETFSAQLDLGGDVSGSLNLTLPNGWVVQASASTAGPGQLTDISGTITRPGSGSAPAAGAAKGKGQGQP